MTNPHFSPPRSLARLLAAGLMAASMVSPLAAAEPAAELAAATTAGAAPSQGAAPAEGLTDAVKNAPAEKPSGKIAGPGVSAAVEAAILKGMQQLMAANAGMKVEEIRTTPIDGLYEVRVGSNVVYADAGGRYVLADAQLLDVENRRNLTSERQMELSRIDFTKDLPLDKAIKQVHGNGERVLAIFEDPNCSYCRRMRQTLAGIDNLTIYTFTYPILAPSSLTKSQKAWCAKDPATAWNDMMTAGTEPDNAGDCKTPIQDVVALGRKLNVTGTPTLFFPDGNRVPGAISPEQLKQILDAQNGQAQPGGAEPKKG